MMSSLPRRLLTFGRQRDQRAAGGPPAWGPPGTPPPTGPGAPPPYGPPPGYGVPPGSGRPGAYGPPPGYGGHGPYAAPGQPGYGVAPVPVPVKGSKQKGGATGGGRPPATPPRRRTGGVLSTGIPVLLFGLMTVLGVAAFALVVGVVLEFRRDLDPPSALETTILTQESIVYDRKGVELARFSEGERREVAEFEDIPPILIDATTAIEDKDFWTNPGFDAQGMIAAAIDAVRGDARGASTITQQLVRQKLLPVDVIQNGSLAERKVKELIQSIRVTQEYAGQAGKERIMAAYLNQNFYGNNSYGVTTAARNYFALTDAQLRRYDLKTDLTLAQAAILAALPQSPSSYDLLRNAVETEVGDPRCVGFDPDKDGVCLVVPDDTLIVERRNYILSLLADQPERLVLTGDTYRRQDFLDAMQEPVIVRDRGLPDWRAPHFVWLVREQLKDALCDPEAESCTALEQGGFRITTTLDWKLQQVAEKWIHAGTLLPHRSDPVAYLEANRAIFKGVSYAPWMANLRGQNVWNGAAAMIDYQRGEILAYVGSANYYETRRVNKRIQPQYDVLRLGWRQPGSAFKPFNYVTGIDAKTITASSMIMDVTTDFGRGYMPTNFDRYERGPLRVRLAKGAGAWKRRRS